MKIKPGYKLTEIGEIPEEWEVVRLGDVLKFVRNGLTYRQNDQGIGYPTTRIETISDGVIDTNKLGYIENLSDDEVEEYKLEIGDILFSHINSIKHFAKTAIYLGKPRVLIHGMNLLLLRSSKEKVAPIFLLHYLKYEETRNRFRKWAKRAVNQVSINQSEVQKFLIVRPPLPEQQKIASILSTVDETIQKTDEIIAKSQELKKGLMQKLLTRGIGHTKFKQTEIGEIPEEWDVVRLGDICSIRKNKSSPTGDMIATIPMELIPEDGLYAGYIMKKKSAVKSGVFCRSGDLLLAKITPCFENGKQGIVPKVPNEIAIATTEVYPIVCDKTDTLYLFYLLKRTTVRNILASRMTGTTGRQRIPKTVLNNLLIPFPSLHEQQKIAEILSAVDEKIEKEKQRKEQLEKLRRGLMQDLLTGRVRVKVN